MTDAFTFNDILLVPNYSDIERGDIDLNTMFCGHKMSVPVISSPMDTVTGVSMCKEMKKNGALGIYHRYEYDTDQEKTKLASKTIDGMAVSPSMSREFLKSLRSNNPELIVVIDVAHGHTKRNLDFAKLLQDIGFDYIMSGNIATPNAAWDYLEAGVNILRVGIGSGHACITRTQIGVGVPQGQVIYDIYNDIYETGQNFTIISDGGHRNTGDIVKALALGADYVMLGSMLAGTHESLGGNNYRGMASKEAQLARGKQDFVVEGVSKTVDNKGHVKDVLADIKSSIEQACYYLGARNLKELKGSEFIRISQQSWVEGLA
jgi:IMP dehydrogenase